MRLLSLYLLSLAALTALVALVGCTPAAITPDEERDAPPPIFPDYAGCTVPPNIAPMNFALEEAYDRAVATFFYVGGEFSVAARRGQFTIPPGRWHRMLEASVGGTVMVRVTSQADGRWTRYAPFELHVSPEPVDSHIAYRLIEPGYELWNRVGIYQRNLETYDQSAILENSSTRGSCMNCHSFCMQDPDRMMLHLRGPVAATMMMDGDRVEKLNTRTPQTMSALVYPSWHPGGRFVAFSVNDTHQAFHPNDPNRVEVYDSASDVVVYDTETHEILTTPLLHDTFDFESFPSFSPDGRTLYFSSAVGIADMMNDYRQVRYSLCAIGFDPEARRFGTSVDTLYNARTGRRSASFPRVSPDGRRLLYTLSDYGGFAIWHKEADLWMIDLSTGEHSPLTAANGPDADSYHSWSSNSRWIVFAGRRIDGLYSRPFIAYIDPEGCAHKAFVVPQKRVDLYHRLMYSYNVPEFIKGEVKDRRRAISRSAKGDKGIDVTAISAE